MGTLKIAGIGAAALLLCFATGAGYAAPRPGGPHPGPHPGGGPRPGGGPHFVAHAAPHFAAHVAPHFVAHAAPHITMRGAPHITMHPHVTMHATPHISHLGRPAGAGIAHLNHGHPGPLNTAHGNRLVHPGTAGTAAVTNGARNAGVTTTHAHIARIAGAAGPRNFVRNRSFAHNAAFRSFLAGRWHPHHHLGWVGPLFWPYAYGDLFYNALWPYDYDNYDPFWAYGYGDIYDGIFSPYNYEPYVEGPNAQPRMTALSQGVAQSCTNEAAEVTGWPIDQIKDTIAPNPQQNALLDDLGNAIVKASNVIQSHCPTTVAFTPTDRLAQMQQRLQGMVQAVNIVQPALAKFYDALSDEQKARFNDMGAPGKRPRHGQQATQNPQNQCGENAVSWPTEQIDRIVQPNDAQRTKLRALDSAATQAADTIKAACPSEVPGTPPDRLAAEGKRLQAMLQGVETIRPKLDAFYASLSDEQKARFNNLGRQLFAQYRGR